MRLKLITLSAALVTLSAGPVLAAPANTAAPLSLSGASVRAASGTAKASHLQGGDLFAAIGALGIGAAAIILATTAHKGHPASQ